MAPKKLISRFTPSRTHPEVLEAIFVQRAELLNDTVERVVESARSKNKHHVLLVGPHGSGKTHLLTLLFQRIAGLTELGPRVRIAWLNEDDSTATVLDLLLRIHRALSKSWPVEFPESELEALFDSSREAAEEQLKRSLIARLKGGCLILLIENLDEVLEGIGVDGQHDLRALLQDNPFFCVVATACRLFDAVQRRESPFFGLFQVEHLEPLSVAAASELLQKIAELHGQKELAGFLGSPRGHARVRALHHLAGGNHRLHIVLSEFITRASIDSLVQPFDELLDQLTPYYRERVRSLPVQQRKIVECLAGVDGPLPVKDIARHIFASSQTTATQLKALKDGGYVENQVHGRESYYELAEPMLRFCLRNKHNQLSEPASLLLNFLRTWYDHRKLEKPSTAAGDAAEVVLLALRSGLGEPNWLAQLTPIVGRYARHQALGDLGEGLVRSLAGLAESGIDARGYEAWRRAWLVLGAEHRDLLVPLRLFSAGVEYLMGRSEKSLLQLPKEERAIVRDALGMPETAAQGVRPIAEVASR